MKLPALQNIANRCQFLVRTTLDTKYTPYNNWDSYGGQSAYELDQLIQRIAPWPRLQIWIQEPVGDFQLCSLCDLVTLRYLMFKQWGSCRAPAYDGPPVVCPYPIVDFLAAEIPKNPPYPTGPLPVGIQLTTEQGEWLLADGYTPLPCYRDWIALGLGPPPQVWVPPPGSCNTNWNAAPG